MPCTLPVVAFVSVQRSDSVSRYRHCTGRPHRPERCLQPRRTYKIKGVRGTTPWACGGAGERRGLVVPTKNSFGCPSFFPPQGFKGQPKRASIFFWSEGKQWRKECLPVRQSKGRDRFLLRRHDWQKSGASLAWRPEKKCACTPFSPLGTHSLSFPSLFQIRSSVPSYLLIVM